MSIQLPEGFLVQAPHAEDAQAVTALICECDTADYGEPDYSVEDLRADWRRGGFEPERDAWLICAPDGALAGYGNVWDTGMHARVDPTTCVHPKFRERGLEDFHIAHVEEWTREHADCPTVQWIVAVDQRHWTERFERRGYHTTRHDYVMELKMEKPPPAPETANGFVVRAFEGGKDDSAVWSCLQEAFRDHRGHSDMEFEEWKSSFLKHGDWSPDLSTVVTEGDEVVAAAMAFRFENGGWIRSLGVRRPWRKKGLGLAMLYRVFNECYARGVMRVGLGVDAESLTGATRLYERAGMRVKNHYVRYEKEFKKIEPQG
jgi:GNAT superfamily N-acetyltransferase